MHLNAFQGQQVKAGLLILSTLLWIKDSLLLTE